MASDNVDLPDLSHDAAPGAGAALLTSDAPQAEVSKRSAHDL